MAAVIDWEPELASAPDHEPLAVQPVAFCDDQVSVIAVLTAASAAEAVSVAAGAWVGVEGGVLPPLELPPPQPGKASTSNKRPALRLTDPNRTN